MFTLKKSFGAVVMIAATALAMKAQTGNEWQTIDSYRDGQIDSHALVVPYRAGDVKAISEMQYDKSPYYLDLNGKWKFKWTKNPANRPVGFQNPTFDVSGWDDITVPGNWERQGYGTTVYTNTTYEFDSEWAGFKKDWPTVPTATNEVGSYRRSFTVPANWEGRRVVLCLEGAISFYYAWVNGEYLGCNMGSKTAAEWDITDKLRDGENTVSIEVYRWSSGAYYECQDFWRLSGIERDVYLYSTPTTYISDFTVRTPLDATYTDGKLDMDVNVAGLPEVKTEKRKGAKKEQVAETYTVDYTLFDAKGVEVLSGSAKAKDDTRFTATLKNAEKWNAEHPYLYTMEVNLRDASGKVTHTVGCNVGFKTSEVKDGLFMVNGHPIKIKGVNRHAHSQMGRTVPRELALKDIELLKTNNINTVRNCHYPQDRYWYYLCDKYGIYLIDEANAESHGYGYGKESLAKRNEWTNAVKDRCLRMWMKSKNNPSVTFYSLGNECGNGVVFEEAYKMMKRLEGNRPVQYERTLNDYNSDIFAEMYRDPWFVKHYVTNPKTPNKRPYILCEYSHAMGNSVGGLVDYWNVFEAYPSAQGACIWDWVDQAFIETDADGNKYYAYGGDYGPANVPSDNSFLCNGLISADRKPHPHLAEVKKVYQYIKSSLVDPAKLAVKVKNWNDFTNLSAFNLNWKVVTPEGAVLASGKKNVNCAPYDTVVVELGQCPEIVTPEAYLDLSWSPVADAPFIPAGTEVAYDQFVIAGTPVAAADARLAKMKRKGNKFTAGKVTFEVSEETGEIFSLNGGNRQLLSTPIQLSLYRPLTENDAAWDGKGRLWRKESLDSISQKLVSLTSKDNVVTATTTITGREGVSVGTAVYNYSVSREGVLAINCNFTPDTATISNMPRVGLTFRMPEADVPTVTYLGRSGETYVDRKQAGRIGQYTVTPKEDFFIYNVPSTAGNHTDVRWVKLDGADVFVKSTTPFQFSAYPYSDELLEKATHVNDVKSDGMLTVHLDAAQTGVGTATCGPDVYAHYQLPIKPYDFTFYLQIGGAKK